MKVTQSKIKFPFILTAICVLFHGCGGGSSNNDDTDSGQDGGNINVRLSGFSSASDGVGNLRVPIDIGANVSGAQLLVSAASAQGRLTSIIDPVGNEILTDTSGRVTGATDSQILPIALNLPLPSQAILAGRYIATFELKEKGKNKPLPDTEVNAQVITKRDTDLQRGTIKVNIIFLGAAGDAQNTRESIEGAMGIAQTIMGRAGLALDIQYYDIDGPNRAPDPRKGDSLYEEISNLTRHQAVNVVIAPDVEGLGTKSFQFSMPPSIPGPVIPSQKSVVTLSVIDLTYGDGIFDFYERGVSSNRGHNDEERLAAEEICQLIGHYLGLTHNVELNGNRVTSNDVLDDTNSCLTESNCLLDQQVRENIMFPYPMAKIPHRNEFYPRDQISASQAALLNASALVQ